MTLRTMVSMSFVAMEDFGRVLQASVSRILPAVSRLQCALPRHPHTQTSLLCFSLTMWPLIQRDPSPLEKVSTMVATRPWTKCLMMILGWPCLTSNARKMTQARIQHTWKQQSGQSALPSRVAVKSRLCGQTDWSRARPRHKGHPLARRVCHI